MLRRGSLARRSATEWGSRGLLAVIAAAGAYVGVTHTLASTLRGGDVERAYALTPGDGRVVGLLAQKLSGAEATAKDRARSDRLARAALRRDPTVVAAVSALGINAQVRGDMAGARRLFAYAGALSRRDLQAQIWAIEDAVGRGDIPGALKHYDIALRTSRRAPDLLFPILASAIADPAIRAALTGTLAGGPVWGASFVSYVAGNGADPRSTSSLLLALRRAGVPVSDEANATAINALMAGDLLDEAWFHYSSVRPGADRRMSRDPRFIAEVVSPSVFDWTPIDAAGVSVSIQRGDGGGVVDFAAPASVGGPLLRQSQMLPPGNYRLVGRSAELDQLENARPYWTLTCRDGRELGRITMPNSIQANGVFRGRFDVPAGCPTQILTLVARPSNAIAGLVGRILEVRLYPARSPASEFPFRKGKGR